MNKRNITILFILICYKGDAAILQPSTSSHNSCLGDKVKVLCNVSENILHWRWQSGTIDDDLIYFVSDTQRRWLNIMRNWTEIPGVSTTLIDLGFQTPLYVVSSLQFTGSDECSVVRVTCNDDSLIVKMQDCSLLHQDYRVAHFNYSIYDLGFFDLAWSVRTNRSLQYFASDLTNNYDVQDGPSNSSFIRLNLQYDIEYIFEIEVELCERKQPFSTFNLTLMKCSFNSTYIVLKQFTSLDNESLVSQFECNNWHNNNCTKIYGTLNSDTNCTKELACQLPLLDKNTSSLIHFTNISKSRLSFRCISGYQPMTVVNARCNTSRMWIPNPNDHICTKSLETYPEQTTSLSFIIIARRRWSYLGIIVAPCFIASFFLVFAVTIIIVKKWHKGKMLEKKKSPQKFMSISDSNQMDVPMSASLSRNAAYGIAPSLFAGKDPIYEDILDINSHT